MRTILSVAAVAALLCGGMAVAQAAGTMDGRIHLAQMNSAGDGLDGRTASRQGNARPGGMGSAGPRSMRKKRMMRKRR